MLGRERGTSSGAQKNASNYDSADYTAAADAAWKLTGLAADEGGAGLGQQAGAGAVSATRRGDRFTGRTPSGAAQEER